MLQVTHENGNAGTQHKHGKYDTVAKPTKQGK